MTAISRNLGTAKQACEIAGVTPSTLRSWLHQGLISAVRVGSGPFRYDLDSVAAMAVEYPCPTVDERIRELVDAAPEFTPSRSTRFDSCCTVVPIMPPEWDKPGPTPETGPLETSVEATDNPKGTAPPLECVASQQCSWWEVHRFVEPLLARVKSWPMLGTPAWCVLGDADPRKTAALLSAAEHWALRVETCQEQRAEASHDVSGAADWKAIGPRCSAAARSTFRGRWHDRHRRLQD